MSSVQDYLVETDPKSPVLASIVGKNPLSRLSDCLEAGIPRPLWFKFREWDTANNKKAAAGDWFAMRDWYQGPLGLDLPYCFHCLDSSNNIWLPLGREYKPLGCDWHSYVDYDEHVERAVHFASDPTKFKGVWTYHPNPLWLYLRDDGTPASTYFGRLVKLMGYRQHSLTRDEVQHFHRRRLRRAFADIKERFGESALTKLLRESVGHGQGSLAELVGDSPARMRFTDGYLDLRTRG